MRLLGRASAVVLTGVLGVAAGFYFGRASTATWLPARDPNDYEVTQQAARFNELVQKVLSYIEARHGEMPVDPYRDLVQSGAVPSFRDFLFSGSVVLFEPMRLPPKIHRDLSKNAKAPFFWLPRPDILEVWVCHLDGTWEREKRCTAQLGTLGRFGESLLRWDKDFHGAGYPYWASIEEKEAWIAREEDGLLWDEKKRMYVPGGGEPGVQTNPASIPNN